MSFRDFFSAQSASYAQFRPRYPAALFDFLVAQTPHHRLAWDVGTGNGQAAIDLGARFDRVVATDASAAQISRAIAHERVEYAVRPAESSGLADGSTALVTAAQCLHWFATPAFYAEVKRVLSAGGLFAAWAYGFYESGEARLDAVMQKIGAQILGPYWPPEPMQILNGYRDLLFPLNEIATPEVRLEMRWNLRDLVGYFESWSATQRFREANGVHPLETVWDDLAGAWGDPASRRNLSCRLVFRAGR